MKIDTITIIGKSPKNRRPKASKLEAFIFEEQPYPVFAPTISCRDLEKGCFYLEEGTLILWSSNLYSCKEIISYPSNRNIIIKVDMFKADVSPEMISFLAPIEQEEN